MKTKTALRRITFCKKKETYISCKFTYYVSNPISTTILKFTGF